MVQKVEIVSVNTSKEKGTIKSPVDIIKIDELGVTGDAHAGHWHRQVSLLGLESYEKSRTKNGELLAIGSFAENITTHGLTLHEANIFDRFVCGTVKLEITQIGKKCHKGCNIMQLTGDCVMPTDGIFCRVLGLGSLKTGDVLEYIPYEIKVKIITLSDRAFNGVYEDLSGPHAIQLMEKFFNANKRRFSVERLILPDNRAQLEAELEKIREENIDILITTGGTGIGSRDITPDVVRPFLDKEIPGIMEHIRTKYGLQKPNALISRSIAGVMGSTLVYVLPGSVKGVEEYLNEITPTIEHSLRMLKGIDNH